MSFKGIGYTQVSDKDTVEFKKHVLFLCHDSLEGRAAGSEGEMIAVQYVEDIFQSLKLDRFFKNGYAESFIFIDDDGDVKVSRNVAAFINNDTDSTILIMAHVDHLGMGEIGRASCRERV